MKAIILKDFGGVENLFSMDLPVPAYSNNEVLVKVHAFSINPVDIKTRKGKGVAPILKETNPMILGWDFSGTVVGTGNDESLLRKGDEVFGLINFPDPGKTYAQYIAVQESQLALKPENISHADAAGASLAALTAWQILKDRAKIREGDKVLIHSAAGGVGHYAVQMAKYLGAEVTGTASSANRDFILSLGASVHIDYQKVRFEDVLNDYDFVLDSIGGEYIDRSLKVLKPGGKIVTMPSGASESVREKAVALGMTGEPFSVRPNGNNMKEIADLLRKGVVKTYVSKIFRPDQIQIAHRQIETGKTRGKIVVAFDEN